MTRLAAHSRAHHSLPRKVASWLQRHGIGPGPMLVAVSGGPDSVALLHALIAVRARQPIVIAHLNPQLRAAESEGDEQCVRELHAQLAATVDPPPNLSVARRDVESEAAQANTNLEAMARKLRYSFLAETARQAACPWIATGHTAGDQAETDLHRLLRGTGLAGLRGIAATRRIGQDVTVVRPMLHVSRAEVLGFLDDLGQSAREDSSNRDSKYTRNRIRHALLPSLEKYNPQVRDGLARLAEQASEVFADLEQRARDLLERAELPPAGGLRILDRTVLQTASPLVLRETLRLLWERQDWPLGRMDHDRWQALMDVCRGLTPATDLLGRLRARSQGAVVQIGPY